MFTGRYAMVGFMNNGVNYHYNQMPYAVYFCDGGLHVYEDNSDRGQVGTFVDSQWYRIRIELKPAQGARYLIKADGDTDWTLLYDSNYGSASDFRRGVDVCYGTITLDDLREITTGATPTYRLYTDRVGTSTIG